MLAARLMVSVLHLLANALAGGGVMAASVVPMAEPDRRKLARWSLYALLLGLATGAANAGLVLLGAVPGYVEAALRVPASAYWLIGSEWIFTLFFYLWYLGSWQRLSHRPWLHGLLGVIGATNLLYHFPTLMLVLGEVANNATLAEGQTISRPVFRTLLATPRPALLTLHFWSLSALTAGVVTLAMRDDRQPRVAAAVLGLVATIGLILSGSALLIASPAAASLLRLQTPTGWLLAAAVGCALVLVLQLAQAAASGVTRSLGPLWLTGITATLMTAAALTTG